MISAAQGDGVADLKQALADALPEGPWLYPEDEVSDATDRMIAAELTREQIFNQLHAGAALFVRDRDRDVGGPPGRFDRHPPADPGRARQPESDRDRQGRLAAQAHRRSARESDRRAPRPAVHLFLHVKVNPDGTRTARSTATSGWSGRDSHGEVAAAQRMTEGFGDLHHAPSTSYAGPPPRSGEVKLSTHFGTSSPALPIRLSSNK